MTQTLDKTWEAVRMPLLNHIKIALLKNCVDDILVKFQKKISSSVLNYAKSLPQHVRESEMDDLLTVSKLEFLETIKVWDPEKNEQIWPLAHARILGAMKDHIRHITRSDPSRLYDWVADAAYMYQTVNQRADFSSHIETGEQLNQAMQCLTERERKIVIAHTKFDQTFKKVGEALGISESQVSRIYKKCLEKLRKELSKDT